MFINYFKHVSKAGASFAPLGPPKSFAFKERRNLAVTIRTLDFKI